MKLPDIQSLYDVTDATWPSASVASQSGWIIKNGAGGGKRVSAALQTTPSADINTAELAMQELGQDRLFQIRTGEDTLDAALAIRGYDLIDRVVLLVAPLSELAKSTDAQSRQTPNVTLTNIWAAGGIGPARLDVMNRATCTKSIIQSMIVRWHMLAFTTASPWHTRSRFQKNTDVKVWENWSCMPWLAGQNCKVQNFWP